LNGKIIKELNLIRYEAEWQSSQSWGGENLPGVEKIYQMAKFAKLGWRKFTKKIYQEKIYQ